VDAVEVGTRNLQPSRLFRPAGETYRVVVVQQVTGRQILACLDLREKLYSLFLHQADAPVDNVLLQLEIRDAVAKQSPYAVGFLQHRHRMPEAVQPLGSGQPRGPRADYYDALVGANRRRSGHHPTLLETSLYYGQLELADGHRLFVDVQGTGRLARRWTHTTRELGKAVALLQHFEGLPPATCTDQRVLGRDEATEWTSAGVAERDPAVYAPLRLLH